MSALPFTIPTIPDQPPLSLAAAGPASEPIAPDPAQDKRVLDGALEALLSGVSPYRIAGALKCSLVEMCERFATDHAVERVKTIRTGMKNILDLRIDGLKMLAAGHLETLLRSQTTTLGADQARSMDLMRRACISILRLNPDAKRRSRDDGDGGPRLGGSPSSSSTSSSLSSTRESASVRESHVSREASLRLSASHGMGSAAVPAAGALPFAAARSSSPTGGTPAPPATVDGPRIVAPLQGCAERIDPLPGAAPRADERRPFGPPERAQAEREPVGVEERSDRPP